VIHTIQEIRRQILILTFFRKRITVSMMSFGNVKKFHIYKNNVNRTDNSLSTSNYTGDRNNNKREQLSL